MIFIRYTIGIALIFYICINPCHAQGTSILTFWNKPQTQNESVKPMVKKWSLFNMFGWPQDAHPPFPAKNISLPPRSASVNLGTEPRSLDELNNRAAALKASQMAALEQTRAANLKTADALEKQQAQDQSAMPAASAPQAPGNTQTANPAPRKTIYLRPQASMPVKTFPIAR